MDQGFLNKYTCIFTCMNMETNRVSLCLSRYFTLNVNVIESNVQNMSNTKKKEIAKKYCSENKFGYI